jgi:hypothetical protein
MYSWGEGLYADFPPLQSSARWEGNPYGHSVGHRQRDAHFRCLMSRRSASWGSLPHATHQSRNSETSTRRSPISLLWTQGCARFIRLATSRCVKSASSRSCLSNAGTNPSDLGSLPLAMGQVKHRQERDPRQGRRQNRKIDTKIKSST